MKAMVETQLGTVKRVRVENLRLNLQNPRYDATSSQREALKTMALQQKDKLVRLAQSVLEKGLSPSELPIVAPTDDPAIFTVLEGNRRVAVLKLLASPELLGSLELPPFLARRYKRLQGGGNTVPEEINCAVVPLEEAEHWIRLRHTGENNGEGVIRWSSRATQRFRQSSPALQAVDMVEKSNLLDRDTRENLRDIYLTNVSRVLSTPEARKFLGVDVKDGRLTLISEGALERLAILVSDVANKEISVTKLLGKQDRVEYAKTIATRPLPPQQPQTAPPTTKTKPTKPQSPTSPTRNTLVPKNMKLAIPQTRINQIFNELQQLNIDQFTNSSAVLFRVFVEMSVDDFAQRAKISLKKATGEDLNLREKLRTVAQHLETQGICTKSQLQGIRTVASQNEHVLSVQSWNAYVHNQYYNPTPKDLKNNWDSVQAFIEAIWRA